MLKGLTHSRSPSPASPPFSVFSFRCLHHSRSRLWNTWKTLTFSTLDFVPPEEQKNPMVTYGWWMLMGFLMLLDGFCGFFLVLIFFCLFWSVLVGCWGVLMVLVGFWWVLVGFCWCLCRSCHSDGSFPWRCQSLIETISVHGINHQMQRTKNWRKQKSSKTNNREFLDQTAGSSGRDMWDLGNGQGITHAIPERIWAWKTLQDYEVRIVWVCIYKWLYGVNVYRLHPTPGSK